MEIPISIQIGSVFIYFAIVAIAILWISHTQNKCPKGKGHNFKEIKTEWCEGHDIGFGINTGAYWVTYKCEKCGETFETLD